ncbi:MAG: hypothetical protein GMKNLPBB_02229 [Myxococcota bacterium]|nr:hypothetical protein [Myxococcota bacterium]
MPKLTIDGKEVEVPSGTPIIKAAEQLGITIPHYCYHPRLSSPANCRMCLVEIEKAPKMMPACYTQAAEGMVVKTSSEKTLNAQKAVLEFLFVNHPIDCPICDQSGECKLQDYYMDHGQYHPRFKETKVHGDKAKRLGPHVVLDQERCIKCTRCVRFMDEVARNPQLGMFERGDHSIIDIYPDKPLDDPYSMNVVDICPVGALTNDDFRFHKRVWFLSRTPSICPGCARGCNIEIHHHEGVAYRYLPRENEAVNKSWTCDEGRMTYRWINDHRVLIGHAGRGHEKRIRTRELLPQVAAKLKPLAGSFPTAAFISADASNEEAWAFARFCKDILRVQTVALIGKADGVQDNILRVSDKNPNRAGVQLAFDAAGISLLDYPSVLTKIGAGEIKAVVSFGPDLPSNDSDVLSRLELLVVLAANKSHLTMVADYVLPLGSLLEREGTFVNAFNRIQKFNQGLNPLGQSLDGVAALHELAVAMGQGPSFTLKNAGEAFAALAASAPALNGLTWEKIGSLGLDLNQPAAAA